MNYKKLITDLPLRSRGCTEIIKIFTVTPVSFVSWWLKIFKRETLMNKPDHRTPGPGAGSRHPGPSGRQPLHQIRRHPGAPVGQGLRPLRPALQAGAGQLHRPAARRHDRRPGRRDRGLRPLQPGPGGRDHQHRGDEDQFPGCGQEGEVEAEAHIAKRGRTISLGEVVVRQGERLVAKAMCTYIHLAKK